MTKRLLAFIVVGFFLTIAHFEAHAQSQAKPAAKKTVLWSAGELKWQAVQNVQGVQRAVLAGNPDKGPHRAMIKFAAGTEVPLHTHTADDWGAVISGTLVIGIEGHAPKELGPGSYFLTPGGVKHTTKCKAGSDCVFYSQFVGAFDLKPAEPTAGKK
ncbi:MAG TPA: cupin domain-containing protein [Acidobacteriota bacterium]